MVFFFFLRYFGCPPSFVNIHGNWTAEMEFISYHSFFVYVKLDFVKTLFFVRKKIAWNNNLYGIFTNF